MNTLQKKDLQSLMKTQDTACISLVLDTRQAAFHRAELMQRYDALIRQAKKLMKEQDVPALDIQAIDDALSALKNAQELWLHTQDSLVIYASIHHLQAYSLHYPLTDHVSLSHRFLLKYVIPSLFEIEEFHVLFIRNNQVHLYTAYEHHLVGRTEVQLPQNILDVTEHKGIQARMQSHGTSANGKRSQGFYSGAGETLDMVQEDLMRFYHAVDAKVNQLLKGHTEPMVLVGDENRMHLYRHHSEYPNILTEGLTLDDDHDLALLYQQAQALIHAETMDERDLSIRYIEDHQLKKASKVAMRLADIEYQAYQANIDKLLIWPDEQVARQSDDDVTETIVREVFTHKGKVYTWNQTAAILRHTP